MANQIGKGHIHGLGTGTFTMASLAGYISPKLETLRLTHSAESDEIKAQTGGGVDSIITQNETLECTFDLIPEGTTFANSLLSAGLPDIPSGVGISGLQIIEVGAFANALNTNGSGTSANEWIYLGGGTINGFQDQKWTMTLPLKRYTGIANATLIV